jgi:hypothetical protein
LTDWITPTRAALLHLLADVRELNNGYVAELFLSVVCYSNGSDTVPMMYS